jgi:hypothetical protein
MAWQRATRAPGTRLTVVMNAAIDPMAPKTLMACCSIPA